MEKSLWREVPVEENPMDYITNGIHVPTFLAHEWINALDDHGWDSELLNPEYWQRIGNISDSTFWSVHLALKNKLYKNCCSYITQRCRRHGYSQSQIDHELQLLRGDVTIRIAWPVF